MKTFKVVYEHDGRLLVDREFSTLQDAIKRLDQCPYISPAVLDDDGTLDLTKLTLNDIQHRCIYAVGLPLDDKPQ